MTVYLLKPQGVVQCLAGKSPMCVPRVCHVLFLLMSVVKTLEVEETGWSFHTRCSARCAAVDPSGGQVLMLHSDSKSHVFKRGSHFYAYHLASPQVK